MKREALYDVLGAILVALVLWLAMPYLWSLYGPCIPCPLDCTSKRVEYVAMI